MRNTDALRTRLWLSTVVVAAAAMLAACGRPADTTLNSPVDTSANTAANTPANTTTMGRTDRDAVVTDSGKTAGQVGNDIKQDIREAGQAVADTTKDIAITAEINTLLARDDQLSALKIDVDTTAGQVVLHGNAPTDLARSRAASLAGSVGGVLNVDNRLQVQAGR